MHNNFQAEIKLNFKRFQSKEIAIAAINNLCQLFTLNELKSMVAVMAENKSDSLHALLVDKKKYVFANENKAIEFVGAYIKHVGIDWQFYQLSTRKRNVVIHRQILSFIMRKYTFMSFNEIANALQIIPVPDHTTVVNSCNLISGLLETKDQKIAPFYEKAIEFVKSFEEEKGMDLNSYLLESVKNYYLNELV